MRGLPARANSGARPTLTSSANCANLSSKWAGRCGLPSPLGADSPMYDAGFSISTADTVQRGFGVLLPASPSPASSRAAPRRRKASVHRNGGLPRFGLRRSLAPARDAAEVEPTGTGRPGSQLPSCEPAAKWTASRRTRSSSCAGFGRRPSRRCGSLEPRRTSFSRTAQRAARSGSRELAGHRSGSDPDHRACLATPADRLVWCTCKPMHPPWPNSNTAGAGRCGTLWLSPKDGRSAVVFDAPDRIGGTLDPRIVATHLNPDGITARIWQLTKGVAYRLSGRVVNLSRLGGAEKAPDRWMLPPLLDQKHSYRDKTRPDTAGSVGITDR